IIDRFLDQINNSVGAVPPGSPIVVHTEGGDFVMGEMTTNTISGSTVGQFTQRGVSLAGNINQTINGLLGKEDTKNIGTALEALSASIESDPGISGEKKQELLELLDEISTKAAGPKETIKKGVISRVIDGFSGLCEGMGGLTSA